MSYVARIECSLQCTERPTFAPTVPDRGTLSPRGGLGEAYATSYASHCETSTAGPSGPATRLPASRGRVRTAVALRSLGVAGHLDELLVLARHRHQLQHEGEVGVRGDARLACARRPPLLAKAELARHVQLPLVASAHLEQSLLDRGQRDTVSEPEVVGLRRRENVVKGLPRGLDRPLEANGDEVASLWLRARLASARKDSELMPDFAVVPGEGEGGGAGAGGASS
eukprot:CAMPEP_0206158340 /NCGR_PEP_ID=MMETSP1474-20131121/4751_1 /ASSEMBLY_ACC=CAM_ASM_001110 /TAXON_ID=97495 /ORGANISM="Imantonia sp., Strain RCC918" /LENGTH=225 /DNA_ID=CAMNT_0053558357 /DNA_START=237 /DNA_END=912 /DNA_ORIENTATION=+